MVTHSTLKRRLTCLSGGEEDHIQYLPQDVEETKTKQGALTHILNNSESDLENAISITTRNVCYAYGDDGDFDNTCLRKKSIPILIEFSRDYTSKISRPKSRWMQCQHFFRCNRGSL